MKHLQTRKIWDSLQSSYWFLPTVMAIAAILLASAMLTLDRTSDLDFKKWGWIYTGGPEGARSLLSAIVGSMVSVTATAFSITIVALQLAASNFGARLLRNFMQDKGNQFVLGIFISTFIYCLFILRTVRGEDYNLFVPQLSVTVGIILAIISIGFLIYFIHHATIIIQASHVIEGVSADLNRAIDHLFPERIGKDSPQPTPPIVEIPEHFKQDAVPISSTQTGYLQGINNHQLMKLACESNLILCLKYRPGQFVIENDDFIWVYPQKNVNDKLKEKLNQAFIFGRERTENQDIEFPINQFVEMALRALSPAVNDPFTAIRCIDRLGAGLSRLVQRHFPSRYRFDEQNNLRVIADVVTFEKLVGDAFNPIRQYGRSDVAVTIRLLEAIALIATHTHDPNYHHILRHHADMILRGSRQALPEEQDQQDVEEHYQTVLQAVRN